MQRNIRIQSKEWKDSETYYAILGQRLGFSVVGWEICPSSGIVFSQTGCEIALYQGYRLLFEMGLNRDYLGWGFQKLGLRVYAARLKVSVKGFEFWALGV